MHDRILCGPLVLGGRHFANCRAYPRSSFEFGGLVSDMVGIMQNGFRTFVAALALSIAGFSTSAFAATVYSNPWDSAATDAGAFSQALQQLAGEFILGGNTSVNQATWYGTMYAPDPLDTGDTWNFNLTFYSDAAGLPGAVLASRAVTADVTDTGVDIAGERAYLFDAAFADVALSGATSYWFVVENTGTQQTFRWTRATAGNDTAISQDGGATWDTFDDPTRTPVNFTLYGDLGTTPLPAALPLFATGLGGLGLLGWRRKRKASARAA